MLEKTKAIVLSSIKFKEKSLIVKCFTHSNGLKSYMVRDAFSSNKSSQKKAYFQPLSIIEIEANHKKNGGLDFFKEIKTQNVFHSIQSNIFKSSIALFLSEFLHYSIREEEKNEPLFNFLESSIHWLEENNNIANFHLIFIVEISKFLGFYPEIKNQNLPFFEMIEGVFSDFQSISALNEQETILLKKLLSLNFDTTTKIFQIKDRQVLLKILMDYYSYHLDSFKKPKSLEVLKAVFEN